MLHVAITNQNTHIKETHTNTHTGLPYYASYCAGSLQSAFRGHYIISSPFSHQTASVDPRGTRPSLHYKCLLSWFWQTHLPSRINFNIFLQQNSFHQLRVFFFLWCSKMSQFKPAYWFILAWPCVFLFLICGKHNPISYLYWLCTCADSGHCTQSEPLWWFLRRTGVYVRH